MARYAPLPTEEPEATIAQTGTDADKHTVSTGCPTNNFCTWRLKYTLFVAGIVCIFVFIAAYQTVLKAIQIVAVVAIIVVLFYLIYVYMNKRYNLTTQKNGKLSANEKKQEENTEGTTDPMVNTGDIESVACEEETLHHSKTSEEDNVERIDLTMATRVHSYDAVNRIPVIITEVDSSSDETQENSVMPSAFAKKASTSRIQKYTEYEIMSPEGAVYGYDDIESSRTVVIQRGTNIQAVGFTNCRFTLTTRSAAFHPYDMKKYIDTIAKEMPADWQQLATNLGLPWARIQAVERQHAGDCWRCCQQVLDTWRKNQGRLATTEDLIQAVRETGNQDVAENLEAMQAD